MRVAELKGPLRARSGDDTIEHESWIITLFEPAGLSGSPVREGVAIGTACRRLATPVHQRCHDAAHLLAAQGVGDWCLGFAYGVVDG